MSHRFRGPLPQVLDASLRIPAQKFGSAAAVTSPSSGLQGHQISMAELNVESHVLAIPSLTHITAPRKARRKGDRQRSVKME